MERIVTFVETYLSTSALPKISWTDIIEILIIAYLVYRILIWAKETRAWSLVKGLVVIFVFLFMAVLLQMNTILWIVKNASMVAIMALVIVFQPELRHALESIGRGNVLSSFLPQDDSRHLDMDFTEKTVNEISKACFEMGRAKTGALIVVARADSLADYTRTGIDVDALVTSQLLINIFEHNTPLHDGAVIIKGNRIVSATCYLPLSDNMALSKALGTRHRAGVGISETTDSITVIVSEETGRVSVAMKGKLYGNVNPDDLREKLQAAIVKPQKDEKKFFWKKQRRDNEG
ncbi:MAG: diadenylate cyclase CdaA [Lachnospiraceae bacterium]|nr:diadenylate cyclase CdaA [Lachnospiraceae bacterium]